MRWSYRRDTGIYNSLDLIQKILIPAFLSSRNLLIPPFLFSLDGDLELPKHVLHETNRVRDDDSLCEGG